MWPWYVLSVPVVPPQPGKAVWGESGELVCTKPLPCQPTHFWNDENGSKYRKAYFSKFPGGSRMQAEPPSFPPGLGLRGLILDAPSPCQPSPC